MLMRDHVELCLLVLLAASASVVSQQRSPATLNLLGEAPHGLLDNFKLLTKTQAQCPQSPLVCPGATGQPLSKETQPLASVSPQNESGCIPHPGLATQSWFAPYRGMDLPAELRNIKYRNATVDCNPASCDNPPQCGIPPCRAFSASSGDGGAYRLRKATYLPGTPSLNGLSGCPAQGTQGCRITGEILADQAINKDSHWKGFLMQHPATRFGYTRAAGRNGGVVQCSPAVVEKDNHGRTGSWLKPGAKNCNPDDLKVCTKNVVAHTVLPSQPDNMNRRAVAVFYKTVWCIGPKCYVSKGGSCLRLNKPIMPEWASDSNKDHSRSALIELQAGRYDHGCSAAARKAADLVIASN